jgi:hypothetical protein
MIPVITSAYLSIANSGTGGYSETARFVDERICQSQGELEKPDFYFSLMKKVYPELVELRSTAEEAGWDGYGALPITVDAYYRAAAFLWSLPNSTPVPSVSAEPDGHITFEWYRSPQRTLSVSVSPEGDLHYAALLGPNRAFGTEVFFGQAPKAILDLIQRVSAV